MTKKLIKLSKLLCYVLRHKPESLGLKLQPGGWVNIVVLVGAMKYNDHDYTIADIVKVTIRDDKQRFALSEDNTLIRANQGHSVDVDLGLIHMSPPDILFHGSAERFLKPILDIGLIRGQRHHVHMTENKTTALITGARYGKPILFLIDAKQMCNDGYAFFESENNVWLTDKVPSHYLRVIDDE